MRIRMLCAAALASALPLTTPGAAAAAQPARTAPPVDCPVQTPLPVPHPELYYCGDPMLGPAALPTNEPVGTLLKGYRRFGDLTPTRFLDDFRSAPGKWKFAPDRGFRKVDNKVDMQPYEEPIGTKLDRFGPEKGGYLASAGTPVIQRASTPDALNGTDGGYHCYVVKKRFTVQQGHAGAFYAMPGGGIQQWLDRTYKPKDFKKEDDYKVDQLVKYGYLDGLKPQECTTT